MASEAKPPILAAPVEIRLEIYRHTWTICKEYSDIIPAGYPVRREHEMAYVRLQVEPLHKLVSICRQIRDEVLSEYFHRTQVYLRHEMYPLFGGPYVIQHIESSLLFASYTQHVSLHWNTDVSDGPCRTLDWLLQLKQLKTLELVITHGYLPSCRGIIISKAEEGLSIPQRMELALAGCFGSRYFPRFTALRNLEKIVVKLCFRLHDWECPYPEVHAGIWERTPRFQRIKEILSESVREDLRQPEQQPTYIFEQHIGAIHPEWPRSYRI